MSNKVSYPYPFLSDFLMKKGFTVYPHEMVCGEVNCPHPQNRFVDVAAKKDGKLYAFEYKSVGDYLLRAVKQIENYRLSFDYVVVVAEVPRYDVSVHPTRGVRIKELLRLGAGFWIVNFQRTTEHLEKKQLAETFKKISSIAPIESHEVGTDSYGYLQKDDMWFWMFYSVLDRRSDASTFIKAKEALHKERLFHPSSILKLTNEIGKQKTANKIADILKKHGFTLLRDHHRGFLSQPLSIVEAAQFMAKYNFDYGELYKNYVRKSMDLVDARNRMWKDLQKEIYGVGIRSASQFIRGMVLKGSWKFPLNDDRFLEKCEFNVEIASRIGLIENRSNYYEELGRFADNYLEGNRGILAHVLWYIRKRYCHHPTHCYECPLYSSCFREKDVDCNFTEVVAPKQQNPIKENQEWIMAKFNHNLRILRKQPINQACLTDFG